MRKPSTLNELYTQYSGGLLERKQFEGAIFKTILDDPRHFNLYRWNQDDCADFVSWFYPRLSKAVDSYRKTGASFETYMGAVVRCSAREYRSRMAANKITEYVSWTTRFSDEYVCQTEPEYSEPESVSVPEITLPRKKAPRQFLILILKCYHYMSEDMLDRIAPLAGIEKEYLKKMLDKLRTLRLKRDEDLRSLRERIYCQFYRCIIYEKRLAGMPEDSVMFLRMKAQIQRARQRLAAMRKRLAGIRPDATNRQIAEILGLSKGTVDCSLYVLKNRWNNGLDKSILN
jgi:hypothetical protein